MNRLKAGKYATRSYDEDGSFEKQQMEFAEEKAKKRRKRPVNKKYGGKVTKMKEGGKVPSKYKGFSKLFSVKWILDLLKSMSTVEKLAVAVVVAQLSKVLNLQDVNNG
jgi:hypothetical protein